MTIVIHRRKAVLVEVRSGAPVAERVEIPKVSAADARDRMMRRRARQLRGEVESEFRSHGARVFTGDPMTSAQAFTTGGDS